VSAPEAGHGATWADFALAVLAFAESNPVQFLVVVGALILLTVVAMFLVWLMLPRATVQMERLYRYARGQAREKAKDLFSDDT